MKYPQYNWFFWVLGAKVQVVITTSNYSSAVRRMKKFVGTKKFKYQFGERA